MKHTVHYGHKKNPPPLLFTNTGLVEPAVTAITTPVLTVSKNLHFSIIKKNKYDFNFTYKFQIYIYVSMLMSMYTNFRCIILGMIFFNMVKSYRN